MGASSHASYEESRRAVLHAKEHVARLTPTFSALALTGRWVWKLPLDDVCLIISSRSYERRRECYESLELFLSTLPDALLTGPLPAPRVVDLEALPVRTRS